ncbi:MAG: phosphatase PAP2 family protein [Clostridia bacterium]|nr:phosphatase PAP2 family protein [Deltaproteobacteria bacterium]
MTAVWLEIRALCGGALAFVIAWRLRIVLGMLMLGALAFITVPNDPAWLELVRSVRSPFLVRLAATFSVWGDYLRGTLGFLAILTVASFVVRSKRLRRAALASVLAASFAGGTAVMIRTLVGRPRPRSLLDDGVYGPSIEHTLNSFPSGHSATAFGTACALLPMVPYVGVPAVLFAGGVAWSRMHRNYHHPTDVLVGAALGTMFGLAFGMAGRRRLQA